MITGDFTHWDQEKTAFAPVFQQVVATLKKMDLEHLEPGRYDIDGDQLYVLVQETNTVIPLERKSEFHQRYIDFQYLIRGEELIVVARSSQENVIVDNKLEEHDYALLMEVANEMELWLRPGMFAVFFPDDLHRPGCSKNGGTITKKAVVKIDKDLLRTT